MSGQKYREAWLDWIGRTIAAYNAMSGEEKQELHDWEREHLDGCTGATSDWPGWRRYVGPQPKPHLYPIK